MANDNFKKKGQIITFKEIIKKEELKQALNLRFNVFGKMGYIPKEKYCLETELELDEFDKFSNHIGGFIENQIVAYGRILTKNENPNVTNILKEIVTESKSKKLDYSFYKKKETDFLISEMYPNLDSFAKMKTTKNLPNLAEYSRLSVNPLFRDFGLSVKIAQCVQMYSKYFNKIDIAFVNCILKHTQLNIKKYKFTGKIDGIAKINERAKQKIIGLYILLNDLDKNNKNNKEIWEIKKSFEDNNQYVYER